MKEQSNKSQKPKYQEDKKHENLPGYPSYPESEDIYENYKEEASINPEDTSKTKSPNNTNAWRQNPLDNKANAKDLDIPGTAVDNPKENAVNEDEENKYFSLGSDRHEDLEEDKG